MLVVVCYIMLERLLKYAYKMLYLQSAIVLLIAIGMFFYSGKSVVLSVLLGGIVWILPSWYFICKIFKKHRTTFDKNIIYNFLFAEIAKFVICIILIIVAVKFLPIKVLPFLSGFAGAVAGTCLFPIIF